MLRFDFEKPIIELEEKIKKLDSISVAPEQKKPELDKLNNELKNLKKRIYNHLTGWQRVMISRHPERPYTLDYVNHLFNNFIELHGDRKAGDDPSIIGGFAEFNGETVMVIGHQKGRNLKENQLRNFGMASPEGYRKANRLMKLAEKYNKAIITFIDTPGALPSVEAEARGIGEAIGTNIHDMLRLKVPVISIVIGEGAAAGALGIAVCDRLLMLENTWLAVISPEFCSSILWQSYNHKEEAAEQMKLTAQDLLKAGIIDGIIKEPYGGAHFDPPKTFDLVKSVLQKHLEELHAISDTERIALREQKYNSIGAFIS
ncbi:MAG TPA: acetyl-CoA carboxylase carboxyltransferase subunit alpha [Bacteroidia bacterium]|nr:acetyl-CoA carboxylase carboxyltransferase subunit alpha [Bacteroidia bacterium]HRS59438.1 acetyl-CoA carboxylase carboxyltransferase subunit alpha [Bacteroidia bacterium]HRU68621.1 acetyl-CoA carboxylase carboxyltransferase subunit alpha [Bacteroidia bacterium]